MSASSSPPTAATGRSSRTTRTAVALDFGVTGVPESYVVNPNGIVVAKFEGVTADGLDR